VKRPRSKNGARRGLCVLECMSDVGWREVLARTSVIGRSLSPHAVQERLRALCGPSRIIVVAMLVLVIAGISNCSTVALGIVNVPAHFGSYERRAGLPYGVEPRQLLDVYVPRGATHRPMIVFWYGVVGALGGTPARSPENHVAGTSCACRIPAPASGFLFHEPTWASGDCPKSSRQRGVRRTKLRRANPPNPSLFMIWPCRRSRYARPSWQPRLPTM